ncbi:MAG: helix-turn-helix transcriptional regulator [Spirochaetaceae bacterium]|nr:helix-turn-helix transcriptional regulator [Spirochaetaceae bacterium]
MKTTKSTFDRMMENSEWKNDFEKGYEEFLISEFMCEQMEQADISVRELAAKAGVSPTTIQHLRTGKAENVKVKTLLSVLHELGYSLKPVSSAM